MDKSWMYLEDRWGQQYSKGLAKFLKMAQQHSGGKGKVRCPCSKCRNVPYRSLSIVKNHLQNWGMDATYTVWRFHGEDLGHYEDTDDDNFEDDVNSEDDEWAEQFSDSDDEMQEVLEDLHRGTFPDEELNEIMTDEVVNGKEDELDKFDRLFSASKRRLYRDCKKYSLLLFVVKLLHIKVVNRWSDKSITMILELFKDALPDDNLLPASYYEARKLLADIGLGCKRIHACKNDCILFRKEYAGCQFCPECLESRYKVNDGKDTKIPQKVLRYFPSHVPTSESRASGHESPVANFRGRANRSTNVDAEGPIKQPQEPATMEEKTLRSRQLVYESPGSPTRNRRPNLSNSNHVISGAALTGNANKSPATELRGLIIQSQGTNTVGSEGSHSQHPICGSTSNSMMNMGRNMSDSMNLASGAVSRGATNQRRPVNTLVGSPSNEGPIVPPISTNTSTDNQANSNMEADDAMDETEIEDDNTAPTGTRKRGPNRNVRLEKEIRAKRNEVPDGEAYKPQIDILEDENRAVGEWSASYARELGIIIRQEAIIRVKSWTKIPTANKEKLFTRATDTFKLDSTKKHVKDTVMGDMQRLYTNWRSELHRHYKKLGGGEIAKRNPPFHLQERHEDWIWLCDNIFEDADWKKRSMANAKNRSNLKYVHKMGSKSFAQKRHELRNPETNEKPGPIDFFTIAYRNKNGWAAPVAEETSRMLRDKQLEAEVEGGIQRTEQEIVNEIFCKKSGVVIGQSRGSRGQSRTPNTNGTKENIDSDLQIVVEAQKAELTVAQARIDAQQAEIMKQRAEIEDTKAQISFLYQHFADVLPRQQ